MVNILKIRNQWLLPDKKNPNSVNFFLYPDFASVRVPLALYTPHPFYNNKEMTIKNHTKATEVDIEECVQSNRLYHSDQYHVVSDLEKSRLQQDLLDWYHVEKRTNMPWRKDNDKTWDREVFYIYWNREKFGTNQLLLGRVWANEHTKVNNGTHLSKMKRFIKDHSKQSLGQ
jgi:hypothetical protein